MAYNLGVNVVEVDGRTAPALVAAPLSVAGLLVRSPRGVPNLPVLVRGLADFVATFGGYSEDFFGAHAVRGFFDNEGSQALVVRVIGGSGRAASVDLDDRAGAPVATLRVQAGTRGRPDPGAWGNALSVLVADHPRGSQAIPAQVIGGTAEPFDLTANNTLQVTVNGSSTPITITFGAGDFAAIDAVSAADVASKINRSTTAFRAAVTPDRRLLLSSAVAGPGSRLEVAGSAATPLGFTGGSANSGVDLPTGTTLLALPNTAGFTRGSAVRLETRGRVVAPNAIASAIPDGSGIAVTVSGGTPVPVVLRDADFANPASVEPGEVVAAINRQARGFSAALDAANRLVLMGDGFGTGSTIAVAAPGAGADATAALGLTGAAPVAGNRVYRELEAASESARLVSWASGGPALPTNMAANFARIESAEFDLIVYRDGAEVERFEAVGLQEALDSYVGAVVNDPLVGSRFIAVTDRASASGPGLDLPAETRTSGRLTPVRLGAVAGTNDGDDGGTPVDANYIGDPATRTGLFAFDQHSIQLLACPETTAPGVVSAALTYCEARGDCMFVGTAPEGLDPEGIKAYASAFRGRKVFGALYAPRIQVANPLDTTGNRPLIWIPPTGHILGVYARTADARGVWKAPAGDSARLRNALGVEFDMTDADHTDLVKDGGVNGIRAVPGSGIIIDASRTLSTDPRWLFVGTRRLFNFVKASLRDGLRWVAQEPNDETLRRKVRFNVVSPFLLGLWRRGAFGSDPPEQTFTVKCDAENNPPSEVGLGNFRIEVYFYPVKPAETIIVVVGQQESGTAASEA